MTPNETIRSRDGYRSAVIEHLRDRYRVTFYYGGSRQARRYYGNHEVARAQAQGWADGSLDKP